MLAKIGQCLIVFLCIALPIYAMVVQKKRALVAGYQPDFVLTDPPEPDEYGPEDFVVLALFGDITTADLCCAKLGSEGIECVVLDRPVVKQRVAPSVAVRMRDWERAAALVEEVE